ncbi:MAG TPA: hypothetical protein VFE41_16055 [Acetobacteraceae bacterium]|jgi:hypothetical protein|nr:hypothetical protein [Acetobacteraceae bacterium]
MSNGLSPVGRPAPPRPDNEPRPDSQSRTEWDVATATSHTCNVATASAGQDDVVINIGVTNAGHGHPNKMSVELIKRFSLRPRTAQALRDMLRDLIANIDADRRRGT